MCEDEFRDNVISDCDGKCAVGWKGLECRLRGEVCRFVNQPIMANGNIEQMGLYDKQHFINNSNC